jgi:PAS domain S-box-containing protein
MNPPDQQDRNLPIDGRFRLAFDCAPIGLAIVGLDYRLEKVNKSLCEALGYSETELLTRSIVDITHPDDIGHSKELAAKLFRGDIPSYRLEKRFFTKDGRLVWLDLTALVIRGEQGKAPYGLAMVENITERKHANDALRTSEERYRSFIANSSEAIWRFEAERPIDTTLTIDEQIALFYKYGYLAECNDAMARMYGHARADDIVGTRFGDVALASHPTNVAALRRFFANGYRLHNVQTIELDALGKTKYFSNSVMGIVINQSLMRIWGTQRDETERHQAEQALGHSQQQLSSLAAHLQALRERERANLAREMHDLLGQNLASVKIDLAQMEKRLSEPGNEDALGEISRRLESATQLLNQTITAVKTLSTELRPGVLDQFGLSAAIEWQCQEFERRTDIVCKCKVPAEDSQLSKELSIALFRILQEALTNVACHSQATNCTAELRLDESQAILSISDEGRGITSDQISAPESLGLLGMRERVKTLGGQFIVEGKPGQGTLLTARIPLGDSEQSLQNERTQASRQR